MIIEGLWLAGERAFQIHGHNRNGHCLVLRVSAGCLQKGEGIVLQGTVLV